MTDTTQRNRRQLLAMFAIALLTLGGAYVLFYLARDAGVWGTTNQGAFVQPPLRVAELGLVSESGDLLAPDGSWWLWTVAPNGCSVTCETAVHQLRQLHVLLNKDAQRVRRALITGSGAEPSAVLSRFPKLAHFFDPGGALEEGVYIVDPIGNLVLFYRLSQAGKPVLDDLKRLLKLSQIG
jgi:cytochrome oxidase Cu insertion factor (SCO1/SenC/PrrC family)